MCGICGVVHLDDRPVSRERVAAMTQALVHRGPDDEGFYFSPEDAGPRAGLGFRRLSIIDVAEGRQPMSLGGKTLVFNGEIYNYRELRRFCEDRGRRFRTHSDTEVLLHLYDEEGERCLERLNGMFAFAVWDQDRRELFLARDRLGIKPLYYFFDGKTFAFASELKSLSRSGEVPVQLDPAGVMDFFSYRFVPAPYTVLKGVRKVRPGHGLRLRQDGIAEHPYWRLDPASAPAPGDAEEELLRLLEDSVRLQLVSDVPLGAFLSGGVDSSLVAALMVRHSGRKVKTFSIGFEEGTGVDETVYARKVAAHLGTDHHELILTEKDLAHTETVFSRMNEPVADPTVLPTALLSRFARREVKVVLTGEGGDELFAGYNRYKAVLYAQWVKRCPARLRPLAAALLRRAGRGECFRAIPEVGAGNWFDLNRDFPRASLEPIFRFNAWKSYLADEALVQPPDPDALNRVLDLERRTSLADRLLMKVDMASMGESLEARPPYLDHRLVEFAFRLPASEKIRRFKGKYVLRKAAERFLPAEICWRRKHGFIVPIAKWLGGGSRESLDRLLDRSALDSLGIFEPRSFQNFREKIYNSKDGGAVAALWPAIVLARWWPSLKEDRV